MIQKTTKEITAEFMLHDMFGKDESEKVWVLKEELDKLILELRFLRNFKMDKNGTDVIYYSHIQKIINKYIV